MKRQDLSHSPILQMSKVSPEPGIRMPGAWVLLDLSSGVAAPLWAGFLF